MLCYCIVQKLFMVFCVHCQKPDLFGGCEGLNKYGEMDLKKIFLIVTLFIVHCRGLVQLGAK